MSQSVRQAPETEEVQRQPLEWDGKSSPPVKVLWGRVAALAATIIAAYLLGRVAAPEGVPPEELGRAQTELAAAQDRITELEARLAETTSPESVRPVTPPAGQDAGEPTLAPGQAQPDETGTGDAPGAGAIPAEEGAEAPQNRPETIETYVVREGDSLNTIAREFYGDASLVGLIAEANNITARGRIRVGQKLDLPPKP